MTLTVLQLNRSMITNSPILAADDALELVLPLDLGGAEQTVVTVA